MWFVIFTLSAEQVTLLLLHFLILFFEPVEPVCMCRSHFEGLQLLPNCFLQHTYFLLLILVLLIQLLVSNFLSSRQVAFRQNLTVARSLWAVVDINSCLTLFASCTAAFSSSFFVESSASYWRCSWAYLRNSHVIHCRNEWREHTWLPFGQKSQSTFHC